MISRALDGTDSLTRRNPLLSGRQRVPRERRAVGWDKLAALTARIPNAGERLVRYYGWYSNASRGKRRMTQGAGEAPDTIEEFTEVSASAAKRAWARLITQGSEVDPLICPRCTGPMRIIV